MANTPRFILKYLNLEASNPVYLSQIKIESIKEDSVIFLDVKFDTCAECISVINKLRSKGVSLFELNKHGKWAQI